MAYIIKSGIPVEDEWIVYAFFILLLMCLEPLLGGYIYNHFFHRGERLSVWKYYKVGLSALIYTGINWDAQEIQKKIDENYNH